VKVPVRAASRTTFPALLARCSRLTGHKNRSAFDRYNIVSEGDLRDAAAKLDATAAR